MTGFASLGGEYQGINWVWEIRSVNGRGLDVRTRLPEGYDAVEKIVKAATAKACARGTVNIGLRIKQGTETGAPVLSEVNLDAVIAAVIRTEERAVEKGLSLAVTRAADLLSVRGVIEMAYAKAEDDADLHKAVTADFATVLADFVEARGAEGASLQAILTKQVDQIDALTQQSAALIDERSAKTEEVFRANIQKIMANADGVDEARLTQELAVMAVKSDVMEELDRLRAHINAARDLLATEGPIGRKFDFLTQEFNREANTLCSKSNYTALTQVGLELKTVIDQMREQVQNVE
ncbi:MAG: YicC family protein [Proteobacteria bacterium]|nr:YicC family protein [Pseudomonadota bacterium]